MTTFVCTLPACIALIVFSSSIPDLLRGNRSNTFIMGGGLMILTAALPFIYRKIKTQRGLKDLL